METLITVLALLATATYLTVNHITKRRRVERVFFARGYVYVRIRMTDSTIHKGFMQRGLLRLLKTESNAFQLTLESYKTGATSTVNTHSIASVEVLKPPALRTSRNPFSKIRDNSRTNPKGRK